MNFDGILGILRGIRSGGKRGEVGEKVAEMSGTWVVVRLGRREA